MSYCTTENCHQETSLYLCAGCIVELDDLLRDVPALIPMLAGARAGTSVVRKVGSGGGGGPSGSKEPGSLDAMMLQGLLATLPKRAHGEAMDNPNAGWTLHMAGMWVRSARRLVWGAQEEIVNHEANRERLKDVAPPMTTRELLPWLRTNAKIAITSMDVRDWARRGKITAVEREPFPTYHPLEVLTAWHDTRGKVK